MIWIIVLIGFFVPIIGGFGIYFGVQFPYRQLPETNRTTPLITGTFIQYTGLSVWNYSMWVTEFADMHDLGIDTIILQWVHESQSNKSLYQSEFFSIDTDAISPEMHVPDSNPYGWNPDPDVLTVFFLLAEQYNMTLHLGITVNWDFSSQIGDSNWVTAELALNKKIVIELLQKYGNLTSFGGFYIPYECFQGKFPSADNGEYLGRFFGQISAVFRECELSVLGIQNKIISIAPYIAASGWVPGIKAFWQNFLDYSSVDVLMIQDGIGCHRMDVETQLPIAYGIITEVCKQLEVTFWSDLEIFIIDDFTPAPFSRIQQQLSIEAKYVEKIVVFDIPHYMSRQYSSNAAILWEAYAAYRDILI
jgi:hypothetical protein